MILLGLANSALLMLFNGIGGMSFSELPPEDVAARFMETYPFLRSNSPHFPSLLHLRLRCVG